jgi:hypothetical protein
MAGRFEFQDALMDLFEAHCAYSTRDITELKGKQLLVCLNYFCRLPFGSKTPHIMAPQIKDFVQQLNDIGASLLFVDDGIEELNKETLVDIFTRVHWIRNRFFYFKMIASIRNKISEEDREFFQKNEKLRSLGSTDSLCTYSYRVIWSQDIDNSFDSENYRLIRAPRSAHHQMLYIQSTSPTSELYIEPIVFLKSELTRVIQTIDLNQGKIIEFDFRKLSSSFEIPPKMLRKCLFGVLVYFQLNAKLKGNIKYFDAFVEDITHFPTVYALKRLANLEVLQEQLRFLQSQFQNDQITHKFSEELSLIYKFDIESIHTICCYFFKNEVFSFQSELITFPLPDYGENEYKLRDAVSANLVKYYCNREIQDEILLMHAKCREFTMTVFFPKLEVVEFEFANKVYLKDHIDWVMSQYTKLFPPKYKFEMKFQYFSEEPTRLHIKESEEALLFPEYRIKSPATLFNSLFQFWSSVQHSHPFRTLESFKNSSKADALLFVNLVVLHRLKYINIEKKTLMIPAVSFVKANPNDFAEELILLFELIRNNLLMPDFLVNEKSIYRNFESFMLGNVLDEILYNDSVCSAFLKSIRTVGKNFNKEKLKFDPTSEAFHCTLGIGSDVTNVLDLPQDSIRTGVVKSLTVFYRVIKEFQRAYESFYRLDNISLKADLILNKAFENFVMKDVLICSRIFSFVLENFTIADLFSIDAYYFQQVLSVVQKSLQFVTCACKIKFYHATGSEVDTEFKRWLERNLPFRKNYSLDGGKLIQIICSRFLIFESLQTEDCSFGNEYVKQLQPDFLREAYGVNFDIKAYLEKGRTLVGKLLVFLKDISSSSESSSYDYLLEHLPRISCLLDRVAKFYGYH